MQDSQTVREPPKAQTTTISFERGDGRTRNGVSQSIIDDKKQIYGVIYYAHCTTTSKGYVGQAVSHILNHKRYRPHGTSGRWKQHVSEATNNTKEKQCCYLNNAIRKYSSNQWTIKTIATCALDSTDHVERLMIIEYNTMAPNGYNLTTGGHSGKQASAEVIQKISAAAYRQFGTLEAKKARATSAFKTAWKMRLPEIHSNLIAGMQPTVLKETRSKKIIQVGETKSSFQCKYHTAEEIIDLLRQTMID